MDMEIRKKQQKPRLFKRGDTWHCECDSSTATAETDHHAYARWKMAAWLQPHLRQHSERPPHNSVVN